MGMVQNRAAGLAFSAFLVAAHAVLPADQNGPPVPALRIAVMDPLADRLACDCVAGYAQRKYDRLGKFLEKELGRPVEIRWAESLSSPRARARTGVDLVVGKFSEVVFDARKIGLGVRPLAMLTDKAGSVTQAGLFVVRKDDAARSIEGLKKRRILFGPRESAEKRAAALAALEAFDLPATPAASSPSCSTAALAVVEKEADAAVISSYAMPLLEGCGTVDRGALRIVGRTDPVPFIGVFATDRVSAAGAEKLLRALLAAGKQPALLEALESRDGFLPLMRTGNGGAGDLPEWSDWRGPRRTAITADVPERLPRVKRLLWSRTLTGPGMAGLAVASGRLLVADKGPEDETDIFRCLDADTGEELWKLAYPAAGEMTFTNSPRATPVVHGGLVYLLGAFGDLHCVKLASGEVVWKKNIIKEFGSRLPTWGMSSTPLLAGDKLIVNPGAEKASIVALDPRSGKVLWAAPGEPPGYASFILAEFGGVRQIVGYDAISLGGWDPDTGKRLWRLVPELEGDYNVPTPIAVGRRLLVATENNGTRLYSFDDSGRINPAPIAMNEDLAPDTSTPVVLDGMVFGNAGRLVCLDPANGLRMLWDADEDSFVSYCSFIAGDGRVLVLSQEGTLWLVKATKSRFAPISKLELFDDLPEEERDVWSHPALVGNRFYVRNSLGVYCFLLADTIPQVEDP
jgi:outer membrane protein assembly factor BamB